MTFQPAASCQVLYGTNTRLILLPAIPPPDSYAFLKQQLCDSFAELEKGDIEASLLIGSGYILLELVAYRPGVPAIGVCCRRQPARSMASKVPLAKRHLPGAAQARLFFRHRCHLCCTTCFYDRHLFLLQLELLF